MKRILAFAAIAAVTFVSQAMAQVPSLVNGNLETPNSVLTPTAPYGWRLHNGMVYRIYDPVNDPTAVVRSGTHSVLMPGALGVPGNELQHLLSEEYAPFPNRNWPQITYDPPNGAPITMSFWFNIAESDPMVGSRLGVKLEIKRLNTSNYQEWEQLWVDPDNDMAYPGCIKVTLPDGVTKGIHTNGQWVEYKAIFSQSQIEYHLIPPPAITSARFMALRFGTVTSSGSVWVDDLSFS